MIISGIQPRLVSPGVWEISGVPQGNYKVGIFGGPNQGVRTTELSATTDGQEIDTSDAPALSTVKVHVQLSERKRSHPPWRWRCESLAVM